MNEFIQNKNKVLHSSIIYTLYTSTATEFSHIFLFFYLEQNLRILDVFW